MLTRRSLLKALGALPLVGVAAKMAAETPAPPTRVQHLGDLYPQDPLGQYGRSPLEAPLEEFRARNAANRAVIEAFYRTAAAHEARPSLETVLKWKRVLDS